MEHLQTTITNSNKEKAELQDRINVLEEHINELQNINEHDQNTILPILFTHLQYAIPGLVWEE